VVSRVEICSPWSAQVQHLPMTTFLSVGTHLDIHSWIVSSEVHLTVLTSSYPCCYYNRIEICFSWVRQVRNLVTRRFVSIGTHLNIQSCMMSSEVHLTSLSRVVTTTTESKSVSLGVGSKPTDNIFTLYRTELQEKMSVHYVCSFFFLFSWK